MTDKTDLIREIHEYVTTHGGENTATHLLVQAASAIQTQAAELKAVGAGGVNGPLIGQPQAMPHWMQYDERTDVLTIHGKRYAAGMFGEDGFLSPPGTWLRVCVGSEDCVTLTRASLAANAGREPVAWPKDAAEVREFVGSHFRSLFYANPVGIAPHDNDTYELTAHDLLSAFRWWAENHPSPPEGMVGGLQVYRCKIKSRKQIDREIPREQQGWWADVAAGQKLLLRQAVQSDLDRCTLGGKRSRNPADYMCETHTGGSLVSKVALEYMNPEQNVLAAPPTSSADSSKGE